MSKEEKRLGRRRVANAYLSSVISIALVLLLIGVASLLFVNAGRVSDYFKENMQISILLKQEATDADALACLESVTALPFVKSAEVITREQGEEELRAMLGDGFLSVFESSPVPVSLSVNLDADYVSSDSLALVLPVLQTFKFVDEVSCQQSLVDGLNAGIARISVFLGIFVALLLFISFVLINNTVRISVYNRRFTVHTMQLVGATRAFILRPFLNAAIWQGLISAILACAALAGVLVAVRKSFPSLFDIFSPDMLVISAGVIVLSGVLICLLSTYIVVVKLVSSTKNDLYY